MTDVSPLVWMGVAGMAFVAFMVRGIEPTRRAVLRWGGAGLGALAILASPDADLPHLPPPRNRDGAWRLTMPDALVLRLHTVFVALLIAWVVNAASGSVFWTATLMLALCLYGLSAWLLDFAITADDDRIAAARITGKPLWSHPIDALTAVEVKGREVRLHFGAGETRALPRGLEGRMSLARHLRRRIAERAAP